MCASSTLLSLLMDEALLLQRERERERERCKMVRRHREKEIDKKRKGRILKGCCKREGGKEKQKREC